MRRPLLLAVFAVMISACEGDPRPSTVDGSADASAVDVVLADRAPDDIVTADASDASDATDATDATDVTDAADVLLRNGCPVFTAPVDRPDAAAGDDTWAGFAQGFFRMWCERCHATARVTPEDRMGAPTGYDWNDEASVRRELARIRSAVGVENYMPLTPPNPSCDERRRLIRWIDIGAP